MVAIHPELCHQKLSWEFKLCQGSIAVHVHLACNWAQLHCTWCTLRSLEGNFLAVLCHGQTDRHYGGSYKMVSFCFQDGVLVKGIFLQGAGWDTKNACLIEAEPMQLTCPIPTIHFKPVEGRRKSQRGPCFQNFLLAFLSVHSDVFWSVGVSGLLAGCI